MARFYLLLFLRYFWNGKFDVDVDHIMSQSTDNKLFLKGVWSLSRNLFNVWKISNIISKTYEIAS